MQKLSFLILGPVIVGMAFTLHNRALTVIQVIAGIIYTSLGFLRDGD